MAALIVVQLVALTEPDGRDDVFAAGKPSESTTSHQLALNDVEIRPQPVRHRSTPNSGRQMSIADRCFGAESSHQTSEHDARLSAHCPPNQGLRQGHEGRVGGRSDSRVYATICCTEVG